MKPSKYFLLVIFITLIILNTQISDAGCCTPESTLTCSDTTIADDCASPDDYNTEDCTELDVCDYSVIACCTDTCIDANVEATCPGNFVPGSSCTEVTECQTGICICLPVGSDPFCKTDDVYDEPGCKTACGIDSVYVDTAQQDPSVCIVPTIPTATIQGQVSTQSSTPIENAIISIEDSVGEIATITPIPDGNFEFTGITHGAKTIIVQATGYQGEQIPLSIKPGEIIILAITLAPEGIQKGEIRGTITDSETGADLPGVSVTLDDSSPILTNSQGYYEFTDIDLKDYTITASKLDYFSTTETITISDETPKIVDLELSPKPMGRISGYVKEGTTNIPNADILINGIIRTKTDIDGNYEINLPADSIGIDYTIKATANKFEESSPKSKTLEDGDNLQANFNLVSIPTTCAYPSARPVTSFYINHIKGEKALKLTWTSPNCDNIAGHTIFRQQQDQQKEPIKFIKNTNEYTDTTVEWNTQYKYSIITTYNDQEVRESIEAYSNTITTGDEICEGKYTGEFCQDNYLRKICNAQNKVGSASITSFPADCSPSSYCAGPTTTGETYCKKADCDDPLNAQPFGLYYEELSCLGASNENYCYFDYSDTTIDECIDCNQATACSDYISEDACVVDNCLLAEDNPCKWESTSYSELGKGFCYEEDYNGSDYCELYSKQGTIFSNIAETPETCDLLGNCYSDGIGCNSCDEETTCESYITQQACTGGQEIEISTCSEITASNDDCQLQKCKWDISSSLCYKDADDNDESDCEGSTFADACKRDTVSPTTSLQEEYIVINKENKIEFTTDTDATVLKFCIDKDNTCCPSEELTIENGIAELTASTTIQQDYFQNGHGKGTYYLRYYSIDSNNNQEQVKSSQIFADIDTPKVDILYEIIPDTTQIAGLLYSTINLDVTLNEIAHCEDSLTRVSTSTTVSQLNGSINEWHGSYRREDGLYTYQLNCTDNAGNLNSTTIEFNINAFDYIEIIAPDGVIPSSGPSHASVEFSVNTDNKGTCDLYKGTSYEGSFGTSGGFSHTLTLQNIIVNQYYEDYWAECVDEQTGIIDTGNFLFTIDNQPPATSAVIKVGTNEYKYETPVIEYIDSAEQAKLFFECNDLPENGFGCKTTKHCVSDDIGVSCEPNSATLSINLDETKTVCYSSKDDGDNEEATKCSTFYIDEGLGIKLITPPNQASNTEPFDIEIEVLRDAVECRYARIDFNYGQGAPLFESLGNNRFKITGFDTALVNPYPMHIKCKSQAGFANSIPAIIDIYYDSTTPKIIEAIADPNPVHQGASTTLKITTDDSTICKYDKQESNYESMHGQFQGWAAWEESPGFNDLHEKDIPLTGDDQGEHTYYVACRNRAGDISETKEIIFEVDFNARGRISETLPPEFINYKKDIILGVKTTKDANCYYGQEEFQGRGTTTHSLLLSETFEEGTYTYDDIYCDLIDSRDTTSITFTVDLTNPIVEKINMPDKLCFKGYLQPEFIANDESSDIAEYNYSVYEAGLTKPEIDWITTDLSSPKIEQDEDGNDLNLSTNRTYVFKVSAKDEAGNWADIKQSQGFTLISRMAEECISDNTGPEVNISTEIVRNGVKVTIECTDENGCGIKLYGLSKVNQGCNATIDYISSVRLTQTKNFCWDVADNMGNHVNGSKLIPVNDTDGDGVPDDKDECKNTPYGVHVNTKGCSISRDADNDRVRDIDDLCPNTPIEEIDLVDINGCAPSEKDSDNDGIADLLDQCQNTPIGEAIDTEGCSDSQKDSDDDGMDDAWEKQYNLDPFSTSDADQDLDKDGLTNLEEYEYYKQTGRKVNPNNKDTDDDGWSDKKEIDKGYSPTDPSSHPRAGFIATSFIVIGLLLMALGSAYLIYMTYKPTEKPIVPSTSAPTPQIPIQPVYTPPRADIERRRKMMELQLKRREHTRKQRQAMIEQRRREKEQRRKSIFEAFSLKKKPKQEVKTPAKFEKLTQLRKQKTQPKYDLFKTEKPEKRNEFARLNDLIGEKMHLAKQKHIKPHQKKEMKDIMQRLKQLKKKTRR